MNNRCHGLTINSIKNGKPFDEELEVDESAAQKIEGLILTETLITLGAVYGDDEWAIDISCEGNRSCIVIIDISTGLTYTYLNSIYTNLFVRSETHSNVFVCADMDEFEQDEGHEDALTEVEINGTDCPVLHVCNDKSDLIKIVKYFLTAGAMCPDVNWLKS